MEWRNVLIFLSDNDAYHWGSACSEFSVTLQQFLEHRMYLYGVWLANRVQALRLQPGLADL